MSSTETLHGYSSTSPARLQFGTLWTFTVTLFTSAFLLFLIQPMFTKMVLPRLGGSPAVWSLALVFFQGVLLLGYLYAHLLAHRVKPRIAVPVHLCVMAIALLSLPIAIPAGWEDAPATGLPVWLIGLFAVSVGLPFFAVSANAPLLQSWFSRTGHPHADDPYFLYGASNIGSFAALLLYPFLLEPLTALGTQTEVWSTIYVLLMLLIATSGYFAWRAGEATVQYHAVADAAMPTWTERATWCGLSFVPSGLLVGVTAYISTDLVAAPFLWVIPLALFLLTFVITFQRVPVLRHEWMLKLHSFGVAPLCLVMFSPFVSLWLLPLHLAAVFVSTMVCHGELVRRRPAARHLTEFYLLMSLGGVLGGLFASLIAPYIFDRVYEYPILMLAVFACRRDVRATIAARFTPDMLAFLAVPVAIAAVMLFGSEAGLQVLIWWLAISFLALFFLWNHPLAQAGVLSAALIICLSMGVNQNVVERNRSFFGVNTVYAMKSGTYHLLAHGTTMHGAQAWTDAAGTPLTGKPAPASYFYAGGPYDTAVRHLRAGRGQLASVAVVGLGAGTLACYAEPGETWKFFEIDPEVIRIAQNPKLFTFMLQCAPGSHVVLGDGRLTVQKEPAASYDLIVLDAFSSDSVPVHLLTAEAVGMYFTKLKPGGALIFNISNRYMELASVIAAVAKTQGAAAYFNTLDMAAWKPDGSQFQTRPLIGVVSKDAAGFGTLPGDERWHTGVPETVAPWTDDYSNVLGAIWRHLDGR